ncbi:TadE/TadG family type IV pilus assembly protein [Oceanirhabdus sp. W0125-5]|uniref:TadE/TadG family type IV pilus assembly protein n=1 Tax=Oceanirhabdus sp. W0125-5 TaxID=2999116 RepID=UPI0022F30442|nr:TadE/TadG family type IV pilus assembly protein [Oceanirhabdus sp. W0125-5]WBW95545.1 TadE/TadG family type IV pilus assembly protein [Oceanirhabdus sp. W0125-5]
MRKEKGQAVVEIALVLPILLVLLCGVIDFGRILYASIHLNMVSQEAVRMGGLGKSDSAIVEYVNDTVDLANKDTISVNITPNDSNRSSGEYVTVQINYQVKYITPIIGVFISTPYNVSTKSTIRIE